MAILEAIIFDVDGTLADTERDGHRPAFNQAFAEAGLDWEWTVPVYGELLSTTGGKERIRRYMDENGLTLPSADGDEQAAIAALHAAKTRHYVALTTGKGIDLRPGVVSLIREAKAAGIRLAIATTTTPANVDALLQNGPLSDYKDLFEVIAAGDIVPAKKPAPDIYVHAMEQMGIKPENCIAVEDSSPGLASALESGIPTVLVTTSVYTEGQNFDGAALVVDQLGDEDLRPINRETGKPLESAVNVEILRSLHQ
ncbi:MAG: HAD-IA family hydrolase [bacterium]